MDRKKQTLTENIKYNFIIFGITPPGLRWSGSPDLSPPICLKQGWWGVMLRLTTTCNFLAPPLVMMLLASPDPAQLSPVSEPTEWMNGQRGVYLGRGEARGGGNHGHLVIRLASWPRNKHQPQTKLCNTLKPTEEDFIISFSWFSIKVMGVKMWMTPKCLSHFRWVISKVSNYQSCPETMKCYWFCVLITTIIFVWC